MNFRDIMKTPSQPEPSPTFSQAKHAREHAGESVTKLKALVASHPGLSKAELRKLHIVSDKLLDQLPSIASRGHLQKVRGDDFTTLYYPLDHKDSAVQPKAEPQPEPIQTPPIVVKAPGLPDPSVIEELAREFVWETGNMSLKGFVEWMKQRG